LVVSLAERPRVLKRIAAIWPHHAGLSRPKMSPVSGIADTPVGTSGQGL